MIKNLCHVHRRLIFIINKELNNPKNKETKGTAWRVLNEDMQKANIHVFEYSPSLTTRATKTKTILRLHFIPIIKATNKKSNVIKQCQGAKAPEFTVDHWKQIKVIFR